MGDCDCDCAEFMEVVDVVCEGLSVAVFCPLGRLLMLDISSPNPMPFELLVFPSALLEPELEPLAAVVPSLASSIRAIFDCFCPSQKSQATHPSIVHILPQLTTDMGLTRSWKIAVKQQTKITTEQTCCTITVKSATKGQKS